MFDIICHHNEPCGLGRGPLAARGRAAPVIAPAAAACLMSVDELVAFLLRLSGTCTFVPLLGTLRSGDAPDHDALFHSPR